LVRIGTDYAGGEDGRGCRGCDGGGEKRVEVGCSAAGAGDRSGGPRIGNVEAGNERLGIRVWSGCWWGRGLFGRKAEKVLFDELKGLAEVRKASCFGAFMGRGDEIVDSEFVFVKERVYMVLVEDFGTLGGGEDEVEEEREADPRVERNPDKDEFSP